MTTTPEPARWDRTIYRGTDHEWVARRIDANGNPLIPTSAAAQIRSRSGGVLWAEASVTIDPEDGWITVSVPEAATLGEEWDRRTEGVWDLEVILSGLRYRWVSGRIDVSQEVTK